MCRGPIVLATDGTNQSGAPVVAAQVLAARVGLPLEVVSVIEPVPMFGSELDTGLALSLDLDECLGDARETAVMDYVARFAGGAAPPLVHVRRGGVAQEIARFARDVSASIIVVGAAPHRRLRHVLSGERAAHVLRSADCPVLSVAPRFSGLPRTALAAIDFGPSSVRAALAALLVLDDHGTLILTHILPQLMSPAALSSPPASDPATDMHELFDRVRAEIAPYVPEGVKVETRLVTGDPVDGILTSMEHVSADIVAVGTRGPGVFARMLLGSVADSVVHAAEQTVLAVPPPPAMEALEILRRVLGVAMSERSQEWSAALDAFTRRNAGRDVMLEVSEPERGAQVTGHGYALAGVTYEPATREVEIMVGDPNRPLRHLTRSVRHPDSITLTAASGGRGEILDIRHGRGHTLVAVTHEDTPEARPA